MNAIVKKPRAGTASNAPARTVPVRRAPMTLRQMQKKVDDAVASFGGYWGPFEMLARLTEELGEIASDLQRNHGLRPRKSVTDIEEEVGDLLFTLGAFANIHKLDLEAAFARVLDKYAERDLRAWKAKQAQQKGR